eukprot:7370521-Prymnesium_polylepis.1
MLTARLQMMQQLGRGPSGKRKKYTRVSKDGGDDGYDEDDGVPTASLSEGAGDHGGGPSVDYGKPLSVGGEWLPDKPQQRKPVPEFDL